MIRKIIKLTILFLAGLCIIKCITSPIHHTWFSDSVEGGACFLYCTNSKDTLVLFTNKMNHCNIYVSTNMGRHWGEPVLRLENTNFSGPPSLKYIVKDMFVFGELEVGATNCSERLNIYNSNRYLFRYDIKGNTMSYSEIPSNEKSSFLYDKMDAQDSSYSYHISYDDCFYVQKDTSIYYTTTGNFKELLKVGDNILITERDSNFPEENWIKIWSFNPSTKEMKSLYEKTGYGVISDLQANGKTISCLIGNRGSFFILSDLLYSLDGGLHWRIQRLHDLDVLDNCLLPDEFIYFGSLLTRVKLRP